MMELPSPESADRYELPHGFDRTDALSEPDSDLAEVLDDTAGGVILDLPGVLQGDRADFSNVKGDRRPQHNIEGRRARRADGFDRARRESNQANLNTARRTFFHGGLRGGDLARAIAEERGTSSDSFDN